MSVSFTNIKAFTNVEAFFMPKKSPNCLNKHFELALDAHIIGASQSIKKSILKLNTNSYTLC
jgi:hypothetical protein